MTALILANLALALGTSASGLTGFGSNLVATPLLVLIDPHLVPGPAVASSLVTNAVMMWLYHTQHPWRTLRGALAGLIPGVVLGAVVLSVLPTSGLEITVGLVALAAAAIAAWSPERQVLASSHLAGFLSGVLQTSVSIGGPPMALWSKDCPPAERRALLPRFFLAASVVALLALVLSHHFTTSSSLLALEIIPGSLAGLAVSRLVVRRHPERTWRVLVLALVALGGVTALIHGLGV